jgi:hypothetical protein
MQPQDTILASATFVCCSPSTLQEVPEAIAEGFKKTEPEEQVRCIDAWFKWLA